MISIAMFNNKGGVGKTTLTCNLASHLAKQHNKKVLIVDCDPQCNATQLIMGIEYAADLYWLEDKQRTNTTISDILQPIEDGDANILSDIKPILSSRNRFGVDLIAGHPKLSIVEDKLSESWQLLVSGDTGGFRKSNWNTQLCHLLKDSYDFVFFDLGPSLGSINRSVLIGCHFFLTPMGSDIFSILGVRNIATWLNSWLGFYENAVKTSEIKGGKLEEYNIPKNLPIKSGYLGYTIQQYITKTIDGVRRATKAYEDIISAVPDEIAHSLQKFASQQFQSESLKLGDVPHLYSLIPLGQSAASPILDLKTSDGLVGPQFKQLETYRNLIDSITDRLTANLQTVN